MQYPALFTPTGEVKEKVPYLGPFDITFRDIPEIKLSAETLDSGLANAKEALEETLEKYLDDDRAIPNPTITTAGERIIVIDRELEARVAKSNYMYPVFIRGNEDGTTTVRFRDIPELDLEYDPREDSDQLQQVIRDKINGYVTAKLDDAADKIQAVDLPVPSDIFTEEVYLYSLDFSLLINIKICNHTPVLYSISRKLGLELGISEDNTSFVVADPINLKKVELSKAKTNEMINELQEISDYMFEPIEEFVIGVDIEDIDDEQTT